MKFPAFFSAVMAYTTIVSCAIHERTPSISSASQCEPLGNSEHIDRCANKSELPQSQTTSSLKAGKIPTYKIETNRYLKLVTNAGSMMMLTIANTGQNNSASYFLECGEIAITGTIAPNQPTMAYSKIMDWKGCCLLVANMTPLEAPASITLSLAGQ